MVLTPLHHLRPRRPWFIKAWFSVVLVMVAPATAPAVDISELLQRHRIEALTPARRAPEVTLTDLDGGAFRLQDAGGEWVLLTFFATWCRPCVTEMPTLEQLHRKHRRAGLRVIGVALDGPADAVRQFVVGLGVSFPVLLDTGAAARAYGASSIPVSYLISPEGRLVGRARGARDWSAMGSLWPSLLSGSDPHSVADGPDASSTARSLNLEVPQAQIQGPARAPRAGESFEVAVVVHWAGTLKDYVLLPPHLPLPEGMTLEGMRASTSSEAGGTEVTYWLTLSASQPGRYTLGPLETRYTPHGETTPQSSRTPGPTVEVAATSAFAAYAVGVALALVVVAVGLGLRWSKRRRQSPPASDAAAMLAAHQAALERLRKARLAGKLIEMLEELQVLEGDLGLDHDPAMLEQWLEQARYAGQRPPNIALDARLRSVERALDQLQSEAETERRAQISEQRTRESNLTQPPQRGLS